MPAALAPSSCRVTVNNATRRLDLCLPANVPVTLLIPPVVDAFGDLTGDHDQPVHPSSPAHYELSRVAGGPLSERKSLAEMGIRDGDLLVLNRVTPTVRTPANDDTAAAISSALDNRSEWSRDGARAAGQIAMLWCTALALTLLLLNSTTEARVTLCITASAVASLALAGALAARHRYVDASATVWCSVSATLLAAAAGFLAVPGERLAPKLLLTAAVSMTTAAVAVRMTRTGTAVLTAAISLSALATSVASASVLIPLSLAATASTLAAVSVALLVCAARMTITITRLPLPRPAGETPGPIINKEAVSVHANRADTVLTGFVCAFSASATLGCHLAIVAEGVRGLWLAATVGISLVLRSRLHVSFFQSAALIAGGALTLGAAFLRAGTYWPWATPWFCLLAAVAGAGALILGCSAPCLNSSPVLRRCVDATEYGALAALIPVAAWVSGVYAAARGLHLA